MGMKTGSGCTLLPSINKPEYFVPEMQNRRESMEDYMNYSPEGVGLTGAPGGGK
jgi:hypothetical protein